MSVTRYASLDRARLRPETAAARRALFAAAREGLARHTGSGQVGSAFFVPGRIEVLGKHTDYAGGRSLLCASEQGFCVVARKRPDAVVRVVDAVGNQVCDTALDPDIGPVLGHWTNYPSTVVRRIARNFPDARRGCDLAFASNLPSAAGMSSSSAFMIAVYLPLAGVNALPEQKAYRASISHAEDLAAYLATIENGKSFGELPGDRGVGTFGGSEDHTAILCCREGELSQYRFAPVRRERQVTWPSGCALVVASSGVVAEKTGAALVAYNRASLSASRVLDVWRTTTGRDDATLDAALASSPGAADTLRAALRSTRAGDFTAEVLVKRLDQFESESRDILPRAADALAAGQLEAFGALVARSQDGAERWLGNQVPETVTLARDARRCGAIAASAFGAGFGGSVWAMVPSADVDGFIARWSAGYAQQHPGPARGAAFFETRPGSPALQFDSID